MGEGNLPPQLCDGSTLLDRLALAEREVVFLFGSALTLPQAAGHPGVPGTDGVVEIIQARVAEKGGKPLLEKLEAAIEGSSNPYQAAFQFLSTHLGPDTSNWVIRKAVLQARNKTSDARENIQQALQLNGYEEACKAIRDHTQGWHLRPSLMALGQILAGHAKLFGGAVLTTNFDPLIDVAIKFQGGSSHRSVLHGDGSLVVGHGDGTHVVYLHGSWYESDTLHTPVALTQARDELINSLRGLIAGRTLAVFGYGGWDDIVTEALGKIAQDQEARPDIVWAFREDDAEAIRNRYGRVFDRLQGAIGRSRATFFKGVDLHAFLPKLAERLGKGTALFSTGSLRPDGPECLTSNIYQAPSEWNPASLLNARYEAVDFYDPLRDAELEALRAWCQEESPTRVRLILGPGGAGKTRLLIEWCKRLQGAGWHAGFLKDEVDETAFRDLLASPFATCAVVDYAGAHRGLERWLKLLSERRRDGAARFRLVLLSREEGEWLQGLKERDDGVRDLLSRDIPLTIRSASGETTLRQDLFQRAFAAFAEKLGKNRTPTSADLSDDRF